MVPLMLLGTAIAVLPILGTSVSEHRKRGLATVEPTSPTTRAASSARPVVERTHAEHVGEPEAHDLARVGGTATQRRQRPCGATATARPS
jgi:hypothetical protein